MIKERQFLFFPIFLCFIGGFLESYSLNCRGFWGLMMTGNTVYAISSLFSGDMKTFFIYSPVILCFFLATFLSLWIKNKYCLKKSVTISLCVIICLIVFESAIPCTYKGERIKAEIELINNSDAYVYTVYKNSIYSVLGNCICSFIGANFLVFFNSYKNIPYTGTMLTANINRLCENVFNRLYLKKIKKDNKSAHPLFCFFVFFSFLFGVVCFNILYSISIRFLTIDNCMKFYYCNFTLIIPLALLIFLVQCRNQCE